MRVFVSLVLAALLGAACQTLLHGAGGATGAAVGSLAGPGGAAAGAATGVAAGELLYQDSFAEADQKDPGDEVTWGELQAVLGTELVKATGADEQIKTWLRYAALGLAAYLIYNEIHKRKNHGSTPSAEGTPD